MRYYYEKPEVWHQVFGKTYICGHPVYTRCTLYQHDIRGLAVIQQRYSSEDKSTSWTEIDPWLANDIYLHPGFKKYFDSHSDKPVDDLYPTVTVRQIMWALKMKPIKRERWETVFDRTRI